MVYGGPLGFKVERSVPGRGGLPLLETCCVVRGGPLERASLLEFCGGRGGAFGGSLDDFGGSLDDGGGVFWLEFFGWLV